MLSLALTAVMAACSPSGGISESAAPAQRDLGVCQYGSVDITSGVPVTISWESQIVDLEGRVVTTPEGDGAAVEVLVYGVPLEELTERCADDTVRELGEPLRGGAHTSEQGRSKIYDDHMFPGVGESAFVRLLDESWLPIAGVMVQTVDDEGRDSIVLTGAAE